MNASALFEPYDRYLRMRAHEPVWQDETGVWHVYRYADVLRVCTDHETFSSRYSFGRNLLGETMIRQDPPAHARLRRLASQAFTARRITRLEPRIRAVTVDLLAAAGGEQIDVIRDFAAPLPVIVIAELLGIERERQAEFRRWAETFTSLGMREPTEDEARALRDMETYFVAAIQQRRRSPANDLIGALVRAESDEGRLSTSELLAFCYLLLVAGLETTTSLIGNAVICLVQNLETLDRVRADRGLLPAVIEETLRFLAPTQSNVRVTRTDTVLAGIAIPAGSRVMMWNASANRDESAFDQPDRFDIDRDVSRHVTFGHGIHYCLGSSLARVEGRVALDGLLDRMPGRWRIPSGRLRRVAPFFLCGTTSMPLVTT